ncbi:MAG: hypothetical protein J6S67_03125 [Methanobrevibacter sp.]|nr:hypothetical protein [Methanobrevibacter sp.]
MELQEIKFTVERTLTAEDLDDIFTTAIESGYEGIGYWAILDNTDPAWEKAEADLKAEGKELYWGTVATRVLLNGDAIKFEDAEGEEDDSDWILDMEKFKKGCGLYEKERGSLIKNLENGSFDAVEADCLVQYCVFGEVVFG